MSDLKALIERLEQATGPDRELDAEIHAACVVPPFGRYWEPNYEGKAGAVGVGPYFGQVPQAPLYTASLDRAMTLVPEGWRLRDLCQANPLMKADMALAVLAPNEEYDSSEESPLGVHLTSPAIALCIAALKARMEVGNE